MAEERAARLAAAEALERSERSNAALRESERNFRHLTERALDLITILDDDATIRVESRSITTELGHPPEEYMVRNAFDFVHPEDAPRVMQAFLNASNKRLDRFTYRGQAQVVSLALRSFQFRREFQFQLIALEVELRDALEQSLNLWCGNLLAAHALVSEVILNAIRSGVRKAEGIVAWLCDWKAVELHRREKSLAERVEGIACRNCYEVGGLQDVHVAAAEHWQSDELACRVEYLKEAIGGSPSIGGAIQRADKDNALRGLVGDAKGNVRYLVDCICGSV